MSYQDRYKGRKIKDPPSFGRFGMFILVGAAFAAFVGCLRGLDSSLCALATLFVVAFKLLVELIVTRAKISIPERFSNLPLAVWLLIWLAPIPPFWFVLRTMWPKNLDPNGAISTLTAICFILYIPTIMAIAKPINKNDGSQNKAESSDVGAEKINFNVDFNAPVDGDSQPTQQEEKPKSKAKSKKKGKK